MAHSNSAQHQHHARETYRNKSVARRRVEQVNAAGFRAYTVDMGPAVPRRERFAVLISEGRRTDLSGLPKPAGGAR